MALGAPVVPEEKRMFDSVSGLTDVAANLRTSAGCSRAGLMKESQVVSAEARTRSALLSTGVTTTAGGLSPEMEATFAYNGTFLPAQSR